SLLRSRVYFYYQTTLKADDYWKQESKFWDKDVENFLSKNAGIAAITAKVISPADPPEQKVRNLYAFISTLKNESANPNAVKEKGYPLEYRSPECIMQSGIDGLAVSGAAGCVQDKDSPADEKNKKRGVKDVLSQGGGTHNELNRLFVAL